MNKKNKSGGETVGVCQMQAGTSVACVKRGKTALPALQFCNWEPFVSADSRQDSLQALVKEQKLQDCHAVSVLPPDFYQLIQIELADLPLEERREAARWQLGEMLDFPTEQAVIDLFEVAPFGSDKKPLTYAVAAKEELLRERVKLLGEVGLNMAAIDVPEFSLRNLAELFEDERGTAILLLMDQGGLLTVVREGVHYLTRDLASGMNDLLPYAEGDFEALTEQLDSVVLEIQRTFDYCESTFHLPMVSRLLVAQTEKDIPAVISYLNDYLTTQVEPFSLDSVMTIPEGVEQIELNRNLLAIGGALRQGGG